MFSRAVLKKNAKLSIARAGIVIFGITLFLIFACNIADYIVQLRADPVALPFDPSSFESITEYFNSVDADKLFELFKSSYELPWSAALVLLLYSLFTSVLKAGFRSTCLQVSRNQPVRFRSLFDSFDYWLKVLLLTIVLDLCTAFFSIFLLIPGLVFACAYSQSLYFLIDDPTLSVFEAMKRSRRIMRGHKWEYFIYRLSFFWWYLLESITAGIATVWVTPYMTVCDGGYFDHVNGRPENAAE